MLTPTPIIQSNHDEYREYAEHLYQMRNVAGVHLASVLLPPLIEIVKDYFFKKSPFTSLALRGPVVESEQRPPDIVLEWRQISTRAIHYSQYAAMMLVPEAVTRRLDPCYLNRALHITPLGIPNDPYLVVLPDELRLFQTNEVIERRNSNYIVAATSNHTHTHLFIAHGYNGTIVCSIYTLGARPQFVKRLTSNPVPYSSSEFVSISSSADAVVMLHSKKSNLSDTSSEMWFTIWDQNSLSLITTITMELVANVIRATRMFQPLVALGPTSITIMNSIIDHETDHTSMRIDFDPPPAAALDAAIDTDKTDK